MRGGLLKNPFVFGAAIGMLVAVLNISIASIAERLYCRSYLEGQSGYRGREKLLCKG